MINHIMQHKKWTPQRHSGTTCVTPYRLRLIFKTNGLRNIDINLHITCIMLVLRLLTYCTSGSSVHGTMSTGTARLKRRLDEQGINYTTKKAAENYCLVRLSAEVFPLDRERERTSCLDRHSTCLP
jgi:hypothetical protein